MSGKADVCLYLYTQNPKELGKILGSLSPTERSFPPVSPKMKMIIAGSSLDKTNLLDFTFTNYYNHSVPELSISYPNELVSNDCPDDLCSKDEVYELLYTLDTSMQMQR